MRIAIFAMMEKGSFPLSLKTYDTEKLSTDQRTKDRGSQTEGN